MASASTASAPGHAAAAPSSGGARIHCVVVTPEKTLLDERVDFVAIPLFDGELGVMPGRAPLIGRLGYGELRTEFAGLTRRYFVEGGFAQVRDNVVTLLTQRALPVGDLQEADASRDLERAIELKAVTDAQMTEKEKALAKARAELRLARRKA